MNKIWTAVKILLEQFGIKLSVAELVPMLLKSRVAWCVVVALVVQLQGCGASRESWREGYARGCQECGNGRVEPLPDGEESWYPFKHMRRWMFGTSAMESPPTVEDYEPTLAEPEVIDAPGEVE